MGYDIGIDFGMIWEAAKKEHADITDGVFSGHNLFVKDNSAFIK